MKLPKLTLFGMLFGIALIIFMDVRYLWIYYDLSEALVWTLFGMLIIGLSLLYEKIKKQSYEIEAMGNHLADWDNEREDNKLTPEKLKVMIKEI